MKTFFTFLFLFSSSLTYAQSYVFWTDHTNDNINRANLDGTSTSVIASSLTDPKGIAIDHINGHIYYIESPSGDNNDKIIRMDLDGLNVTELITTGIDNAVCIALDVAGGKMYWTDYTDESIKRADLDGSSIEKIISTSSADPQGIALDLINNKIYWTEGNTDKIRRSDLDGSNPVDLITSGINKPYGIALDIENNYMYWIEQTSDTLARAELDGSNHVDLRKLLTSGTARDIDIDHINGKLYWTDTGTNRLYWCDLDGTNADYVSIGDSYGLALYNVGPGTTFSGSGNWSNADRWNNGVPNSATKNVVIDGECTLDGSYSVNDFGLTSSAVVSVNSSSTLTVSGALVNAAGSSSFLLQSDASNTASLMVSESSSSDSLTVERYMTGDGSTWHLLGVPVSGQDINDFITESGNSFATSDTKYGLGLYIEAEDSWTNYTAASVGVLTPGIGYESNRSADGDISFKGKLSVGEVEVTLAKTTNGWNLLGNPYPCALNAIDDDHASNNFLTINATAIDDSFEALYFWDPTANAGAGEYVAVNHATGVATYIASGQAFFVKASANGEKVSFTHDMRTHQTGASFKSSSAGGSVKLKADNGEEMRSTELRFIEGTTMSLDPGYDAGLFNGNSDDFILASRLIQDNNVDFLLQCLPTDDYEIVDIPIQLYSTEENIEFSVETNNLPDGIKVYLEDKQDGSFHLLSDDKTYTAQVNIGENTDRFVLHTSQQALDQMTELEEGEYQIMADAQNGSIIIQGEINNGALLSIIDITGRIVYENSITSPRVNIPALNNGIYIAKISNGTETYTQKITWIK